MKRNHPIKTKVYTRAVVAIMLFSSWGGGCAQRASTVVGPLGTPVRADGVAVGINQRGLE